MNRIRRSLFVIGLSVAAVAGNRMPAQQPTPQTPDIARFVVEPASLTLKVGDSASLKITAYDANGGVIPKAAYRVSGPRTAVAVSRNGNVVRALAAGTYEVVVNASGGSARAVTQVPVAITWPALSRLVIARDSGRLYTGVTLGHTVTGQTKDGIERKGFSATWRSSDPVVATVNRFGEVTALRPGSVTITAEAEGVTGSMRHTIVTNPVARIEIDVAENTLRTGDAIMLKAAAKRANGTLVTDAPITWAYTYMPDDSLVSGGVQGGPGIIRFGRFAPNYPGRYTVIAQAGSVSARKTLDVRPRDARRKISDVGRGTVDYVHSSDLWPWRGADGRDYCIIGTWGGNGWALVFDITDLSNIRKTDSVQVDARTINDVTVSPNARYAVLSREGASNRINGVVILDISTPAHPKIASTFDENLTGGVHNVFATDDYLFAVSGGQKYVIIDMKDIYKPKYVSEYAHPGARIHDLWVHDGIAYSAQSGAGAVVVDVGNGKYGGSIEKPKLISTYAVNSGHEIFPYFQKSTGRVYLFMGDEETRQGRVWEGTTFQLSGPGNVPPKGGVPQTLGGYTHIIDFTDPMHPVPVGRYHLEDYGTHDIIVQDDILYQAYYEGGVRLVDVSGNLMGNLADQGREIAVFKPFDPTGYTANAPFVMNAMPWKKDYVLFTDFNSGLWAARMEPKAPPVP